ncbi:MAG: carbohydrate ABC transporter permease [Chloroflexota bacterium]
MAATQQAHGASTASLSSSKTSDGKKDGFLASRSGQTLVMNGLTYLILIMWAIVFMFPLLWMVSTSLKVTGQEFKYPPEMIPNPFAWINYPDALTALPFHIYFKNTMIIVFMRMIGALLTSSMAAFAFARLRFPGRNILFSLVLSVMILPEMATLVPTYILFNELGWVDTLRPLYFPFLFGGSAFFVFLLRQFFMSIPIELEDAAKIDGASYWRIYWQIILPLATPALGTVAIFTFIGAWNDFAGPLIYLQSNDMKTLALGVYMFRGLYHTQWNVLMAASMTMVVPVLLVFFFAQRFFIEGISTTGFGGR